MTKRIQTYPQICLNCSTIDKELISIKSDMSSYVLNAARSYEFEIQGATYLNGKLTIALNVGTRKKLKVGDQLEVIYKEDKMPMGLFKIREIRSTAYYAEGVSHIDKLWMGYVKDRGEVKMIPNMLAVYVPTGGQNG